VAPDFVGVVGYGVGRKLLLPVGVNLVWTSVFGHRMIK